MIRLYACLGSGNCFKPWLALNQLGLSFEMTLIDVLSGQQKEQTYLDVNPLGVVPFMTTDNAQGIGESNAMLWYLADGTPLMPKTASARATALQWMFFEQSKLEPFISPARFFTTILPAEANNKFRDIAAWQTAAGTGLARLDAHLERNEFILTEGYTIADIATFGYVHVLDEAGLNRSDYPAISRWIESVEHTDGFVPLQTLGANQASAA